MNLLAIIAMAMLTAAPIGDRFDLVCTSSSGDARFRVDLTQGKWCRQKCEDVYSIDRVTPDTLALMEVGEFYTRIDRQNLSWSEASFAGFGTVKREGKCRPETFSGLR